MAQRVYAEDAEFRHALFVVKGKRNIFGAHYFWDLINQRTEAKVKRLGNQSCLLRSYQSRYGGCLCVTHSMLCIVSTNNILYTAAVLWHAWPSRWAFPAGNAIKVVSLTN